MTTIGYVRTYDLPVEPAAELTAPLPEWFTALVTPPFLDKRRPYAVDLGPLRCRVGGETYELSYLLVVFPHLRLLQVHFWFGLPQFDGEISDGLFPFEIGLEDGPELAFVEHRPARLADQLYVRATGVPVTAVTPRRTDLAALLFGEAGSFPAALAPMGAFDGNQVAAAAYDLQVRGPSAQTMEVIAPVLVVAGVLGRARLLRKRLTEVVADVADSVQAGSFDPWQGVERTAHLQAQYVTFRRELHGEGFLNRARTKRLLSDVAPKLQVPKEHLEDLDVAMGSLDALSHSLMGLAIEDAQKRIGHYGLFFAGLSILFATFAAVDLARSPNNARLWVLAAAAIAGLAFWLVHRRYRRAPRLDTATTPRRRHDG